MKLIHYSAHPWPKRLSWWPPGAGRENMKPVGLWVTPADQDDNWFNWCLGENFGIANLQFGHRVNLKPAANIRWIKTVAELDAFHDEFKAALYPGMRTQWIAWDRVVALYDGLVIDPYQWERRLGSENMWYYTWDCASGCIWRKRAVSSITPHSLLSIDDLVRLAVQKHDRTETEIRAALAEHLKRRERRLAASTAAPPTLADGYE